MSESNMRITFSIRHRTFPGKSPIRTQRCMCMWLQKTLLTHFSVSPSTAVRRETSLSSMIDVKWSTRSFPVFFFFFYFFLLFILLHSHFPFPVFGDGLPSGAFRWEELRNRLQKWVLCLMIKLALFYKRAVS